MPTELSFIIGKSEIYLNSHIIMAFNKSIKSNIKTAPSINNNKIDREQHSKHNLAIFIDAESIIAHSMWYLRDDIKFDEYYLQCV